MNIIKKILKFLLKSLLIIPIFNAIFFHNYVALGIIDSVIISIEPVHHITDVENYGIYLGNNNNKTVRKQITSFFPKKIDDNFSDITYSYKTGSDKDAFSYEAYLEFVIEDKDDYLAFVKEHTKGKEGTTFEYDESFTKYTLEHDLCLDVYYDKGETYPPSSPPKSINIDYSRVQMILCDIREQRIIFSSIGVWDGGATTIDCFGMLFERFDIEPFDFANEVTMIFGSYDSKYQVKP